MPWQEESTMELRRQFIQDVQSGATSVAELCAAYQISRKTGYKWLARYEPVGSPPWVISRVVPCIHRPLRRPSSLRPSWSPAAATPAGARANCSGCCASSCRRRPGPRAARSRSISSARGSCSAPSGAPAGASRAPAGCHGRAQCGLDRRLQRAVPPRQGTRCYPLTIADGFSRMLLSCRALTSTQVRESRPVFVRAFQAYGLPVRIRSDNGVPFATHALGRLSPLSVWWVRLGILPDLIEPASPQQNGRHERMHRTLKADCTRPPSASRRAQQRRFDQWRREFNELRPHQALADTTPSLHYQPSPRPYPRRLPALKYPSHYELRRVSHNGGIRWHTRWVNVSQTLGGEWIGLIEIDDGEWDVYFGPLHLGRFHERTITIDDALHRQDRLNY